MSYTDIQFSKSSKAMVFFISLHFYFSHLAFLGVKQLDLFSMKLVPIFSNSRFRVQLTDDRLSINPVSPS